jgi:plastocyanin
MRKKEDRMNGRLKYLLFGTLLLALFWTAAACGGAEIKPVEDRVAAVERNVSTLKAELASLDAKTGKINAPAGTSTFYLTGVEWKGTTSTTKLAPPSIDPTELSDGYGFKGPGVLDATNPDKWQVASYVWTPGSMIAYQGDQIDLTLFIVNGDEHSTWIEAPDGTEVVVEQEMNRGREYNLTFTATQSGVYRLVCNEHEPTMTAYILALPRG